MVDHVRLPGPGGAALGTAVKLACVDLPHVIDPLRGKFLNVST